MHTGDLVITDCVSLVMQVMTQVVRGSSISRIGSGRIKGAPASTLYTGDCALVIKRWFKRVEQDASGLAFQEWTPDVDTSRPPVTMLIKSSELCAAGFKLKKVIPTAL
jgi:hypothetical protein